jgi:hypothetical protein
MKKIIAVIIIVCSILILYMYNNDIISKRGKGTFDDPYYIQDINEIGKLEDIFKESYPNMLTNSDVKYDDNTDMYWKNHLKNTDSNIYIDSIHYIGNQTQADMMILFTCNGVDKELKQDVNSRFKDEEIMITTSYYSIDVKNNGANTTLFNKENADTFSLRLADDIINDYVKMIVTYKVQYENHWYYLSSLINVESPQFLQIPKELYGIGKIEDN